MGGVVFRGSVVEDDSRHLASTYSLLVKGKMSCRHSVSTAQPSTSVVVADTPPISFLDICEIFRDQNGIIHRTVLAQGVVLHVTPCTYRPFLLTPWS